MTDPRRLDPRGSTTHKPLDKDSSMEENLTTQNPCKRRATEGGSLDMECRSASRPVTPIPSPTSSLSKALNTLKAKNLSATKKHTHEPQHMGWLHIQLQGTTE